MKIESVLKFFLPLMISGLMLAPVLLQPKPARADGPICSSPNLAIPDGLSTDYDTPTPIAGPLAKDTIAVNAPGVIQDMNVVISTTHPFAGDLIFTLTHKVGPVETNSIIYHMPLFDSSAVTITTEPACSGNNIDITLDEEATLNVQFDCKEGYRQNDDVEAYDIGGFYKPYTSSLTVFDGQVLSGTWELAISDNFAQDEGTLNQWCLVPTTEAVDLGISKSDSLVSVAPGGVVSYTLHYSNTGNLTATGVVLSEVVPTGTSFNAASNSGWSCPNGAPAGTTCILAVSDLASGEDGTAVFAVNVLNPAPAGLAQISNTATIGDDGANGGDLNPQNNSDTETTPLEAAPDMRISKTDGGIIAKAGGTITYTLSYTNAGNQGATGVAITETVPANTSFKASGSTAGWSCTPNINAGSTCRLNIGPVAGGNGGGSATFIVGVANPLPGAVTAITNTVQIGDNGANGVDPTPFNNQASKTTAVDPGSPQHYIYLPIVVKS